MNNYIKGSSEKHVLGGLLNFKYVRGHDPRMQTQLFGIGLLWKMIGLSFLVTRYDGWSIAITLTIWKADINVGGSVWTV